ncbi:hypothetical protein Efla_002800 [Eimeria flavescens]
MRVLRESDLERFRTKCCSLSFQKHPPPGGPPHYHQQQQQQQQECEFGAARCHYSHNSHWTRRCPVYLKEPSALRYLPFLCSNVLLGPRETIRDNCCPNGALCPFAHSKEELLFHPLVYKLRPCAAHRFGRCKAFYCWKAHGPLDLRTPKRYTIPSKRNVRLPAIQGVTVVHSLEAAMEAAAAAATAAAEAVAADTPSAAHEQQGGVCLPAAAAAVKRLDVASAAALQPIPRQQQQQQQQQCLREPSGRSSKGATSNASRCGFSCRCNSSKRGPQALSIAAAFRATRQARCPSPQQQQQQRRHQREQQRQQGVLKLHQTLFNTKNMDAAAAGSVCTPRSSSSSSRRSSSKNSVSWEAIGGSGCYESSSSSIGLQRQQWPKRRHRMASPTLLRHAVLLRALTRAHAEAACSLNNPITALSSSSNSKSSMTLGTATPLFTRRGACSFPQQQH